MTINSFRVIVVGGGPVGLTAANVLYKAGIDFLLLERRPNVVIDAGSNLVLNPQGLHVLSQLGLQESIGKVSSPLGLINRVNHQGKDIGSMHWFELMAQRFGTRPRVISRHDLTSVLYNALPASAQANVLANKKLSNILPSPTGVSVTCADGSSYNGSVAIGADGAHSLVRDLMWKLAHPESAGPAESPFLTTYRCLWLRFPTSADLLPGTTCESHGPLAATQLFAGESSAVTGVYERLETPTKERLRFTQADQDALVEKWGHIPLTKDGKVTLRSAYDSRQASGLVSLEEGVVENWSWNGRIVLAGDSAKKMTPSTGAGCNNGMIDVVALVNNLRATLAGNSSPSHVELEAAFKAYQDVRYADVVKAVNGSGQATASATWQTGVHKFIDQYVLSRKALQAFIFPKGSDELLKGTRIDFL